MKYVIITVLLDISDEAHGIQADDNKFKGQNEKLTGYDKLTYMA